VVKTVQWGRRRVFQKYKRRESGPALSRKKKDEISAELEAIVSVSIA
jgi:hypothetical protein